MGHHTGHAFETGRAVLWAVAGAVLLAAAPGGVAHAGYGDAVDGYPLHHERDLLYWTNAVRVDPEAFSEAYGCWSAFLPGEKTPKAPFTWSLELNQAARFHSNDMAANNHFAHESSDGTPFGRRIDRFYTGLTAGENIAQGYPNNQVVVVNGWMCSAGHRANIMQPAFSEAGTSSVSSFYTQNFGSRGQRSRMFGMGLHKPSVPGGSVSFHVDVWADSAPDRVDVVLDGAPYGLQVEFGVPRSGLWYASFQNNEPDACHVYWFEGEADGFSERWPEEGAYGWGPCDFDDEAAGWMGADKVAALLGGTTSEETAGGEEDTGCSTTGSRGTLGALALGLLALGLRRRET